MFNGSMWELIDNTTNGSDLECIVEVRDLADIEWKEICDYFDKDFWFSKDE